MVAQFAHHANFLRVEPTTHCLQVRDVRDDMIDADEDENDMEVDDPLCSTGDKKKKKKKKATKKKSKAAGVQPSNPQHMRNLTGFTDYYVALGQTEPPSKPVAELFPSGRFPVGEILPHGKTKYPNPLSSWARTTEAERRCVALAPTFSFISSLLTITSNDCGLLFV